MWFVLWISSNRWVLPFVGHMGIASSQGIMYDFAGPYSIGVDGLAFGNPTRYMQFDPREVMGEPWDVALRQGCDVYSRRMVFQEDLLLIHRFFFLFLIFFFFGLTAHPLLG